MEDTVIASIFFDANVNSIFNETIRALLVTANMIREATKQDDSIQHVLKLHRTKLPETGLPENLQHFTQQNQSLSVIPKSI